MLTFPVPQSKFDFSNYFGRYEGETVHDVLLKIHQEGQTGSKTTFAGWKKWNHDIWKARYGFEAPIEDTEQAEAQFLEVLVKAGAIYPTATGPNKEPIYHPPGST